MDNQKLELLTGQRAWWDTEVAPAVADSGSQTVLGRRGDTVILCATMGVDFLYRYALPATIALTQEISRQARPLINRLKDQSQRQNR